MAKVPIKRKKPRPLPKFTFEQLIGEALCPYHREGEDLTDTLHRLIAERSKALRFIAAKTLEGWNEDNLRLN